MHSLIIALSAIVALPVALSAPLSSRQAGGGTRALFAASNASFINGQPLAASGGAFYIGVPTDAPCTLPAPQCAQYSNTTAVLIDSLSSSVGMYSTVPSRVYVAQNGVFSFTEPGQVNDVPEGAYEGPFDGQGGVLHFGGGNSGGWIACPLFTPGQLPYQVLNRVSSMGAVCADAIDLAITTTNVDSVAAYEYE
ncbi:MAG: hypothetical protein LQ340_002731 [Diploschistes diacapsis]|nr:MAG: hypothetical protein LQ340_002731 [Diploschistes diacapsis]